MVSVIMSVYNAEATVSLAISSVCSQSYTDFECIICDDGSNDATFSILQYYQQSDGRIKVFHNSKNQGAAAARNTCLEAAQGEYIAIMDADDWSDPERLSSQVDFLENNPQIGFVGTKGRYFRQDVQDNLGEYWFVESPKKEDFLFTLPFVHASILFRRSILLAVQGYREQRAYVRSEDYDLLMRLYKAGNKGYNLAESLYYIRQDDNVYKRRKYRYRLNECLVKFEGFSALGLMPRGIVFALKPLIVGLIPVALLDQIKKKYYKRK